MKNAKIRQIKWDILGNFQTFWVDKSLLKMPKTVNLASFWKPEAFGQTVLPDRSILVGQKLMENAKIEEF